MSTEHEKVLYFGTVFSQALAFPCTSHVWFLPLKHSTSNLHLYILIPLRKKISSKKENLHLAKAVMEYYIFAEK